MSALRRRAHNAAVSPMQSTLSGSSSPTSQPSTPKNSRPRPSYSHYQSPASTPSISSSVPFDWEAVRNRGPAPYATPNKSRRSTRLSTVNPATPGGGRKAFVRKKSFFERVKSLPSQIAFEIAIFPQNVPLPKPKTSAYIIGGFLHFLHLCVRVSQGQVRDSDPGWVAEAKGWEDMYREDRGSSWFDWTAPITLLLLGAAFTNALYLFTRVKVYRLHRQTDPVSSPNAKFVDAESNVEPTEPPSLLLRLNQGFWHLFITFWKFLLGIKSNKKPPMARQNSKVQQLEIWNPGEIETALFSIYSPVHSFLWMATGSSNWILMLFIMGLTGIQLHALTISFQALAKDREIIAAEVMHEYNEGFVYPRINPIRKDVAIMTNESEMVNFWEH